MVSVFKEVQQMFLNDEQDARLNELKTQFNEFVKSLGSDDPALPFRLFGVVIKETSAEKIVDDCFVLLDNLPSKLPLTRYTAELHDGFDILIAALRGEMTIHEYVERADATLN